MSGSDGARHPAWWLFTVLYVVVFLGVIYGNYPFDGMVVNESWNLHDNEVRQFRFPGYGDSTRSGESKTFLYDPATGRYDFSFLHSRRGLVPIIYLTLERTSFGNHIVFMNAVCVAVLAMNLLLFGYIAWRLAGPNRVFPMVALYSLYPFAASSHFLQVIVINNLAVTFLLLSLALFLTMDFSRERWRRNVLGYGLPGLLCYWLSLFNHEYALFLSPLYLYLALYHAHGATTLWKFRQWTSPYACLGYAFVLVGMTAFFFLVSDAPSLLVYAPRFRELAASLHLPLWLVPFLTGSLNASLFFLSAAFSNSIGLLLYPVLGLRDSLAGLSSGWWGMMGIVGLIAVIAVGWRRALRQETTGCDHGGESKDAFLLVVGGAWAVLSYVPFSTSIGYPRIVGLMADRINILAACGIAIALGTVLHAWSRRLVQTGPVGAVAWSSCLAVGAGLLLLNLSVQKEYYVDAYRKEQEIARVVLGAGGEARKVGRPLVVLLDKPVKIVYPREELMAALSRPGLVAKAWGVMGFLFDRHFRQEVVSTSFHLKGLYLFGCCPDTAHQTFDGYAKLWSSHPVPVYKQEEPFRLYQDAETWQVGYQDTKVWSRSFGTDSLAKFGKRDHQLAILELDESFFTFRGRVAYCLRPYPDVIAQQAGS